MKLYGLLVGAIVLCLFAPVEAQNYAARRKVFQQVIDAIPHDYPDDVRAALTRLFDPRRNVNSNGMPYMDRLEALDEKAKRRAAIYLIETLGGRVPIRGKVSLKVPNGSPSMVAAYALNELGDLVRPSLLVAARSHDDLTVRIGALYLLQSSRSELAVGQLYQDVAGGKVELPELSIDPKLYPGQKQFVRMQYERHANEYRRRAIAYLAVPPIDADIRVLRGLLDDKDPKVVIHAARALSKLGELSDRSYDSPISRAVTRLLESSDAEIRHEALALLGRHSDWLVIEPLLAMLDAKTDARERQMAIQALGAHGSGQATARLLAWLEEGEADDVASVLAALGEIGDLRALPALTAHLKHDSPRVRSRAAHALAKMNSRAAVEPLLACLDDGHEDVVTAVMPTFGQLGDPRAFEPLRKRLNDKSIAVTYAAVDALGRLNDPRAAKPLVDLLFERQGNHGGITKTITTALCRTRDPKVMDLIVERLDRVKADSFSSDPVKGALEVLEHFTGHRMGHGMSPQKSRDAWRVFRETYKPIAQE